MVFDITSNSFTSSLVSIFVHRVYPCNIELHRGETGCADISDYPDFVVTSREW